MEQVKDGWRTRELIPQESSEDMELLVPAFLAIWNEAQNLRFLSFTGKTFDEGTVRGWFSHHLEQGVRYYGAIDHAEEIAGIVGTRSALLEGFEVMGIGVRPPAKGKGIGTSLLRRAGDTAAAEGYKAIDALVFSDNAAMLRLLLSLSFVPVSMEYNRRYDGADIVRMKRIL